MNLTTEFPRCGHGCGQTESTAETSNFSEEKSAYSPQKQIITTTEVVVCTDPGRVITGFTPKGALKVWHRITLTGRR